MVEQVNNQAQFQPIYTAHEDMYAKMEKTQEQVEPYFDDIDFDPLVKDLMSFPPEITQEATEIMEQICEKVGGESPIRRLHALMARIAEATENHIFQKKEKEHIKKIEIKEKVGNISSLIRTQGKVSAGGGMGSVLMKVLGSLIPGRIGTALSVGADFVSQGSRGLEHYYNSLMQDDQFEQSLYIQNASSEKQATEGLKNLPKEVQQLIQQLLQLEDKAISSRG